MPCKRGTRPKFEALKRYNAQRRSDPCRKQRKKAAKIISAVNVAAFSVLLLATGGFSQDLSEHFAAMSVMHFLPLNDTVLIATLAAALASFSGVLRSVGRLSFRVLFIYFWGVLLLCVIGTFCAEMVLNLAGVLASSVSDSGAEEVRRELPGPGVSRGFKFGVAAAVILIVAFGAALYVLVLAPSQGALRLLDTLQKRMGLKEMPVESEES
ncbi:MAG TPA: hypothetical protein VG796_20860 [Verrucomicrobiales bacterium]|nr:hypothetical protein [Verrucomicrobiales bacterium]